MAIYLIQHGKALPKDIDPQRGLSEEGIAETSKMRNLLIEHDWEVGEVVHSGKMRAQQTAEILAEAFCPEKGVRQIDGINPMDDVTLFASELHSKSNMVVVGHLPFLENLTSLLLLGEPEERPVKFVNSGVVCLDRADDSESWHLCWAVPPYLA